MDRFLDCLSSYAASLRFEDLPEEVIHESKRRIIDALGCAIGAYLGEPCKIARLYALEVSSSPGSTILGTLHRSSPEVATFTNGVMTRYLDFNDNAGGKDMKEGGHPSDNIPAALALAEYAGSDTKTAMTGVVMGYEVQGRLGEVARLRPQKLDHVFFVSLSAASVAINVLGLSKEEGAHAMALAAIPNVAIRETRRGELTMWKGCAAANAARNGVFAALLAKRGLKGPAEAFEGAFGVVNVVTGPMELPRFADGERPYKIMEAKLKYFPTENSTHSPIHAAIELRNEIRSVEDIKSVVVEAFDQLIEITADTPEKWHPISRETADHSLPYVLAVALMDGNVTLDHFKEERIRDPKTHELMQKVEVRRNDQFTREHPEAQHTRVELVTSSGARYAKEIRYAKGSVKNPMSDDEINRKFIALAEPFLTGKRTSNVLDRLWNLERQQSLSEVLQLFAV